MVSFDSTIILIETNWQSNFSQKSNSFIPFMSQGGRGLQETLRFHLRKFSGILNGIDTEAWNPATDSFLSQQYSADDLHGKAENKEALRKFLNLSTDNSSQPLVRINGSLVLARVIFFYTGIIP